MSNLILAPYREGQGMTAEFRAIRIFDVIDNTVELFRAAIELQKDPDPKVREYVTARLNNIIKGISGSELKP